MAAPSIGKKKRDISSYFTAFSRTTLPQKRPSPILTEDEDVVPVIASKSPAQPKVETPRRLKPYKAEPLTTPHSGKSLDIPLRPSQTEDSPKLRASDTKRLLFPKQSGSISPTKPHASFSFSDLPSSTQTVVRDGEVVAIRDSDDDDTESLMSLDEIFGRKDNRNTTSSSSPPDQDDAEREAERIKILSSFTRGRSEAIVGKDKLRSLYAQEREQKFDISALLGDHFDETEVDANVKKAENSYEISKHEGLRSRRSDEDKKMLAMIAGSNAQDQDDVTRFLNAVDRTEALSGEETYHFFSQPRRRTRRMQPPPCPRNNSEKIACRFWLSDDVNEHSRACLSSHVSDLAAAGDLSEEWLSWAFHQIYREENVGVRRQMIDCVRRASRNWTRNNISCADVQRIFQTLGAGDLDARADRDILTQKSTSRWNATSADLDTVIAVLDLFETISADMDFAALGNLASIACRIALDSEYMSDCKAAAKTEDLLSSLLNLPDMETRTYVHDHVLNDLTQNLSDPVLQAELLSHMPSITRHASAFRRKLAQSFLWSSKSPNIEIEKHDRTSPRMLERYVKESSTFSTTRKAGSDPVDYALLKAATRILDVAIADGGRPEVFGSTLEEKDFNESIDSLAETIRTCFVAISDSGASHMRRTEAKDVLQALYWRLLYAVRTKARPKKNIFDVVTGEHRDAEEFREEERGRQLMHKYFARAIAKAEGPSLDSIAAIGHEPQSGRDSCVSDAENESSAEFELDI